MRTLGYRKGRQPIMLSPEERALHFLLLGGSGSGKSTAMHRWIRQIATGRGGAMLIDPHGTLYDSILAWAALHRLEKTKRIHLIEPRLTDFCPAFNPLDLPTGTLETGVSSLVGSFAQVWGGEDILAHPRLTRILRDTLYVLATNQLTLAEAKLLLAPQQKALRTRLTADLRSDYFREEWGALRQLSEGSARAWVEFIESTDNRIAPFVSSPIVRRIVGQTERSLDIGAAMASGDLVLVNLRTSPHFSEEDARLVGTLLLNDVRLRAFQRPRGARPFFVFVDEAYRYLNRDIESMLVETRKYGVLLVLAMQNLGQARTCGEAIYQSVMSIANKIVFGRLSTEDARTVAEEIFCGEFDLEKPKAGHTMPVTVGYRPIWLKSMSETQSHADFESDGESSGDGDTTTSPAVMETEEDQQAVRVSIGTSRGVSHSRGRSTTRGETQGESQSLMPIIEERATQLYSLDELQYEATARLKTLQPGVAIAKIEGRRPEHIAIPMPGKGLPLSSAEFQDWKEALLKSSAHIASTHQADQEIDMRTQLLLNDVRVSRLPILNVDAEIELTTHPTTENLKQEKSNGHRRTRKK